MKKILLFVIVLAFFVACKDSKNVCKIEGNDCEKVIQLLTKVKEVYSNPELDALGLKLSKAEEFLDGGSTLAVINDNITIFTDHGIDEENVAVQYEEYTQEDGSIIKIPVVYNSKEGYVTVTFKEDGRKFVFDPEGNLKEYPQTENADNMKDDVCKIEGHDCWKVVKASQGKIKKDYSNPDLESIGLKVSKYSNIHDGPITINDKVDIVTKGSDKNYYTTVIFKENGKKFVFNSQGKLQAYTLYKNKKCEKKGNKCWKYIN